MIAYEARFSGSADLTEYVIINRDTTLNYVRVVREINNPAYEGGSKFFLHETLSSDAEAHDYMNIGEWSEISDYRARAVLAAASLKFDDHHTLVGENQQMAALLVSHIASAIQTADEEYKTKIEARKREQQEADERAAKYADDDDADEKFLGASTLAKVRGKSLFDPKDDE